MQLALRWLRGRFSFCGVQDKYAAIYCMHSSVYISRCKCLLRLRAYGTLLLLGEKEPASSSHSHYPNIRYGIMTRDTLDERPTAVTAQFNAPQPTDAFCFFRLDFIPSLISHPFSYLSTAVECSAVKRYWVFFARHSTSLFPAFFFRLSSKSLPVSSHSPYHS